MFDWIRIENPTTIAALTAGTFTIINGIVVAFVALGGVALAQKRQSERDRKADERKLRDNSRDRLRSASKLLLETVWVMYEIIYHHDPNDLVGASVDRQKEFWDKVNGLIATMEQTRAEVAVDVDDENVILAAREMRSLIDDYEVMAMEVIKVGGVDGIGKLRERSGQVQVKVIEAIKTGLKRYEDPL